MWSFKPGGLSLEWPFRTGTTGLPKFRPDKQTVQFIRLKDHQWKYLVQEIYVKWEEKNISGPALFFFIVHLCQCTYHKHSGSLLVVRNTNVLGVISCDSLLHLAKKNKKIKQWVVRKCQYKGSCDVKKIVDAFTNLWDTINEIWDLNTLQQKYHLLHWQVSIKYKVTTRCGTWYQGVVHVLLFLSCLHKMKTTCYCPNMAHMSKT